MFLTFPNHASEPGDVSLWAAVKEERARGSSGALPGEEPATPFLLGVAQYRAEAYSPQECVAEVDVSVVGLPAGQTRWSFSTHEPQMVIIQLENLVRKKLTQLGIAAHKYELHGPGNDHEAATLPSKRSAPDFPSSVSGCGRRRRGPTCQVCGSSFLYH